MNPSKHPAKELEAARLRQEREQELRDFVFEQVRAAQRGPVTQEPVVEPDAATKFARRVRQRRVVV